MEIIQVKWKKMSKKWIIMKARNAVMQWPQKKWRWFTYMYIRKNENKKWEELCDVCGTQLSEKCLCHQNDKQKFEDQTIR